MHPITVRQMVPPFHPRSLLFVAGFAGLAGCSSPSLPGAATGLMGTVSRGPVTPVCLEGVPCDAGFSASFSVLRGGRGVASFRTDSAGGFSIQLAPGSYQVVPGNDAPILDPASQARMVVVDSSGWTMVALHFDTGLR